MERGRTEEAQAGEHKEVVQVKITKQDIDQNVVHLIKENLEWVGAEDDPRWIHHYIGLIDGINQLAEALKGVIDA